MHEILLPVLINDTPQGEEAIPVEPLGGTRFRITASPGMVEGLAAGDELEIDSAEVLGYRLLKRGGNLCVWFYFEHPVDAHDPGVENLTASVERIGGWLDGGQSRMVVFTIPVIAGFPAVERVFDAALEGHPGSQWFFGNVYDPKDGTTPLGWWLSKP